MRMTKKKYQTINLINNINNIIINNNLIKENQCILISISGGQDSICVFFIFLQLRRQWKWTFGVIFCNHLWQKSTFFANSLVLELAYIFKIPIYCAITSTKIFNEYQSRYWRYNIFYRISCFYNYNIISTGHTSSDKVETILFQLIRGSSTKSLTSLSFIKYFLSTNNFAKNIKNQKQYLYSSIKFKTIRKHKLFYENYFRRIFRRKTTELNILLNQRLLVRPILNLHRFDLQKLMSFWNLPIYPDISNVKTYYYRNRIRKQLLPALRFFFNPQIDIILLQFAEIISTEEIYLDILISRLKYDLQNKNKQLFQLNISLFYGIPLAIQRKLIKNILENYSYKQVYFFQIEYIIHIIIEKKTSTFNKYLSKEKKFKKNYFYPVNINTTILNLNQIKWINCKNQKVKKITILNLYLINKKIYTYVNGKKILPYKYINFFKKQFFIKSIDKILIKKKHVNDIRTLKNEMHWSTCLDIYFLVLKESKKSKKLSKFKIRKKNIFNFKKLNQQTNKVTNKMKFSHVELNCNKISTSNFFYKEIFNFISFIYYFQKFRIFFYPEFGILVRSKNKLIILNSLNN